MSERKSTVANNKSADKSHLYQSTPEITEGPFYKPGSPEKTRLFEEGVPGDKLILTGHVFDVRGNPIPHAWLDFWQANGRGEYDNSGYILRGHQYTDKSGKYILETVIPSAYVGRTSHIHIKARANETSPIITTQLFLPGLDSNKNDFLYRKDLEIKMQDSAKRKTATFDFYLED